MPYCEDSLTAFHRFTEERRKKIVAFVLAGHNRSEAAEEFRVSLSTVTDAMRRAGVRTDAKQKHRPPSHVVKKRHPRMGSAEADPPEEAEDKATVERLPLAADSQESWSAISKAPWPPGGLMIKC